MNAQQAETSVLLKPYGITPFGHHLEGSGCVAALGQAVLKGTTRNKLRTADNVFAGLQQYFEHVSGLSNC